MADELVTVANFVYPAEAESARLRLDDAGIPAFVQNDGIVSADWFLGNAVGYVRLDVPADRAMEARAVIETARAQQRERTEQRAAGVVTDDDPVCLSCGELLPAAASRCPACGWSYADGAEEEPEAEDVTSADEPAPIMETMRTYKKPVLLVLFGPVLFMVMIGILVAILFMIWLLGSLIRGR